MAEYDGWTITTGFHAEDLFSVNDPAIDKDASISKYAGLLQAALEARFLGANVDVRYDLNTTGVLPHDLQTRVYDSEDYPQDDEVGSVDEIAGLVFEAGEWYVEVPEEASHA